MTDGEKVQMNEHFLAFKGPFRIVDLDSSELNFLP